MKEHILTIRDYSMIKDIALRIWLERNHSVDNFLAICYSEALILYANSKGWIIEKGKIYCETEKKSD